MVVQAIDTLYVASDWRAYKQLGLGTRSLEDGPPTIHVGRGRDAVGLMFADYKSGVPAGIPIPIRPGLFAARLHDRGVWTTVYQQATWVTDDRAGATLVILSGTWKRDFDAGHSFPLKRLDHLAAVAYDLEKQCRFWEDVLGVAVTGEVRTPTMVIRQLKIGDAIFELLGPSGPDSPIHKRPAGLVSMAAWEVDDLPAAVAQARAAGFTVPDPAPGALPGTRTATIPAAELGGVAMQLLQYV